MADSTETTKAPPPSEFDAQAAYAALSAQLEKLAGVVDKRITGLHQKVTAAPKDPVSSPAPKTEAPSPGPSAQDIQAMISASIEADRLARDLSEEAQAVLAELQAEGIAPKQMALVAKLLKSKQPASTAANGAQAPKPGKAHAPPAPGGTPHPSSLAEYRKLLLAKDSASEAKVKALDADPSFDPTKLK